MKLPRAGIEAEVTPRTPLILRGARGKDLETGLRHPADGISRQKERENRLFERAA